MQVREASAMPRYDFESRAPERVEIVRNPPEYQHYELKRPAIELAPTTMNRGPSSPPPNKKKQRKRANYLQHTERCCIIRRVAGGEPQAALAREFGVTRAAVCQMYKNRKEILAREDSEGEGEMEPQPPTVESRSKTVALLLTTLKDKRTSATAFYQAAARLTL
ncbi:unnamed protein product [Phytophthora lilii]|uniref:Unnamed protein product n=1 Tax=Phytophthora lilii TaxID=2077276 RepID=A0A9W6YIF3_9STRA|nr:unnamed protein product [Phytophthora lilii]